MANNKKLKTTKLKVEPLKFTAIDSAEAIEESPEVSLTTLINQLEKPSSIVEQDIKKYDSIIIAVHNPGEHQLSERGLSRITELKDKVTAELLDRASLIKEEDQQNITTKSKEKEEEDQQNQKKITENRAKLSTLKAKIKATPPKLLEVETNINNHGSPNPTPESIELIIATLQANPNAIIILTTNTPPSAKKILAMFPNHHVYYRYPLSPNPFGDAPADKEFNDRCIQSPLAQIPAKIYTRCQDDHIHPPALSTSEPRSPSFLSTDGALSPTNFSNFSSSQMSPVSAASPEHKTPVSSHSRRITLSGQVIASPSAAPKEPKPGCFSFWKLLKRSSKPK